MRRYLDQQMHGFGFAAGDCHDGSNYDIERFRVRFVVDAVTGQVSNLDVHKSCTMYPNLNFPAVTAGCYGPGNVSLTPTTITGGTKLTAELTNGDFLGQFGPSIDFTLEMKRTGDLLDIRYVGDAFPTIGFWRGYEGGWGNGIVLTEVSEMYLFPPSTERQCRFTLL
jgi:hypothetical protein